MFNILACSRNKAFLKRVSFYANKVSEFEICSIIADSRWMNCFIACRHLGDIDLFIFDLEIIHENMEALRKAFSQEAPDGAFLIMFNSAESYRDIRWRDIDLYFGGRGVMLLDFNNLRMKDLEMVLNVIMEGTLRKKRRSIEVTINRRRRYIETDSIVYCKISRKILTLVCRGRRTFEIRMPLSDMEEMIADKGFVRIHRSYIVNLREIKEFTYKEIVLHLGHKIPIGERYRKAFIKALLKHNCELSDCKQTRKTPGKRPSCLLNV